MVLSSIHNELSDKGLDMGNILALVLGVLLVVSILVLFWVPRFFEVLCEIGVSE